jgi:hypothetical protein
VNKFFHRRKRFTLDAHKAYDTQEFVKDLCEMNITPHVTLNTRNRKSAIDARPTQHSSYQISQAKRYGWRDPLGRYYSCRNQIFNMDPPGPSRTMAGAGASHTPSATPHPRSACPSASVR